MTLMTYAAFTWDQADGRRQSGCHLSGSEQDGKI